jgi:mercuric ion transport protein
MKIQLLSFPECPNVDAARAAIHRALRDARLDLPIEEIDVSRDDAPAWAKRWGSPTVLVDGVDVAGELATDAETSCCRLYKDGAPTVAQIRARLGEASVLRPATAAPRRSRLPIVGGVVAALAASACCLVPAALAVIGVSGAGVASRLAPLRPYFLVVTAIALAAGFWLAYRPVRHDACGCAVPRSRRWSRIGLWFGTVVTLGIAGTPMLFASNASVATHARGVAEVRLKITGMDCAACSKVLAKRLSRVPGVATVDVDYDRALAVVTHDGKRDLTQALLDAVEDVGYEGSVIQ